MKTATEIVTKLHRLYENGVISVSEVREALKQFTAWHVPWVRWDARQVKILYHQYRRQRDKLRAYRQSDFTLARQLDRAKATA